MVKTRQQWKVEAGEVLKDISNPGPAGGNGMPPRAGNATAGGIPKEKRAEPEFRRGQLVLCRREKVWYAAKVVARRYFTQEKSHLYQLHFDGSDSRCDDWIHELYLLPLADLRAKTLIPDFIPTTASARKPIAKSRAKRNNNKSRMRERCTATPDVMPWRLEMFIGEDRFKIKEDKMNLELPEKICIEKLIQEYLGILQKDAEGDSPSHPRAMRNNYKIRAQEFCDQIRAKFNEKMENTPAAINFEQELQQFERIRRLKEVDRKNYTDYYGPVHLIRFLHKVRGGACRELYENPVFGKSLGEFLTYFDENREDLLGSSEYYVDLTL